MESQNQKLFLPQAIMCIIADYMNNYEISKLSGSSTFFYQSMNLHYKLVYKELLNSNLSEQYLRQQHIDNLQQDENDDWIKKYAKINTRTTVQISSNLKLNPHEPEIVKSLVPEQIKTINCKQIAKIYQGGKLNAYLTFSGELTITMKHNFNDISQDSEPQDTYVVEQKVRQVAVGGQDLAFIDEFSRVFSVLCNGNQIIEPQHIQIQEPIKLISVAQNHSFGISEDNNVYCWMQSINLLPPQLVKGIEEGEEILDIKSGNLQTILLTTKQRVYKINHLLEQEQGFYAEPIKKLNNIVQISCSFIHFILLQREDIKPLKEWSSDQVSDWFTNIGLGDASNLIKYKKISGQQIFEADEDFMSDTLGYTSVFEHQKLKFEIGKVKEGTVGKMNIYGWGNNKNGQLGLLGNNVPEPKIIPIPEFKDKKDFIVSISCGLKSTSLLTQKGETWITGYYQPEKILKPTVEEDIESKNFKNQRKISDIAKKHIKTEEERYLFGLERQQQKQSKLKSQKQKNQKYQKELLDYKNETKKQDDKEKSLKHRWTDFTQVFSQSCFGKNYQVEAISIGVKNIVAICSYSFKAINKKQNKHKQGSKFVGADKVIKFLAFQQSIQPNKKFTVCYEDRFLGILEADLDKFLESNDIPFHRIQFFKDNGELIWDRKNKFTIV